MQLKLLSTSLTFAFSSKAPRKTEMSMPYFSHCPNAFGSSFRLGPPLLVTNVQKLTEPPFAVHVTVTLFKKLWPPNDETFGSLFFHKEGADDDVMRPEGCCWVLLTSPIAFGVKMSASLTSFSWMRNVLTHMLSSIVRNPTCSPLSPTFSRHLAESSKKVSILSSNMASVKDLLNANV